MTLAAAVFYPPIAVLFFVHNGFRPPVAGADADGVFDVEDEDLAVADFAGLADALGRFDDFFDRHLAYDCFDLDVRQQVDGVFLAPVYFDVAFLEAAAVDLADGHAHDADGVEGVLQFFQLAGPGYDVYLSNFSVHAYHSL